MLYRSLISCAWVVAAAGGYRAEPAPLHRTTPTMATRRTTTPPATIASEAGRFLGLLDMTPRLRRRGLSPGAWKRGQPSRERERPTLEGQPTAIIARGPRCAPCHHGAMPRRLPARRRNGGPRAARLACGRTGPRTDPARAADARDARAGLAVRPAGRRAPARVGAARGSCSFAASRDCIPATRCPLRADGRSWAAWRRSRSRCCPGSSATTRRCSRCTWSSTCS